MSFSFGGGMTPGQSGGSLFGAPMQSFGSLFGGGAAAGTPQGAGGGFSFGASPSGAPGGVGPSLFGVSTPGQGQNQNQNQPQQQQQPAVSPFGGASGGSLFGGGLGLQSQQQPQPLGGSLFGGGTAPTPSTSLFGAPSQASAAGQTPGGFSFGSAPGTSLFGGSPAGGGPQGSPQQTLQSPSLFGTPGQQPAGSPFGAPGSTSALGTRFGQSPAQQQQNPGSLFNLGGAPGATQPSFGTGAFGGTGGDFGGLQAFQPLQPQQQQQQQLYMPQSIQTIYDSFNPQSSYFRFRHMLYNVVEKNTAQFYTRPADCDEKLWQQAVQSNPDASRMVPVQVCGFDQLQMRVEQQDNRIKQHMAALGKISDNLGAVKEHVKQDASIRVAELRRRQRVQYSRLLAACCRIERLVAKNAPLSSDEIALRNRLQSIKRQMDTPVRLVDRLAELELIANAGGWNSAENLQGSAAARGARSNVKALDKRALHGLKSYLADELRGIESLYDEMESNARDLNVLSAALLEIK